MRTTRRAGIETLVGLALSAGLRPATCRAGSQTPRSYALIAGTVFRDSGLSLPGAEVSLEPDGEAAGRKRKVLRAISDSRGEFAFRVPPEPADYRLTAVAAGFQPEQKQVRIEGEQRIDVFFRLRPASKK